MWFRVSLTSNLSLQSVDYDKEGSILRLRGKNTLENDHVKVLVTSALNNVLCIIFLVSILVDFPWF